MSLGSPTSLKVSLGGSAGSIDNIIHHGAVLGFVFDRGGLGRTWNYNEELLTLQNMRRSATCSIPLFNLTYQHTEF
jgi:hypothetical protein